MKKSTQIEDIHEELLSIFNNLKAEVFVAEILEKSDLDFQDIDIFNRSTFTRSYRRDVINFSIDTNTNNSDDKLQFNLARNGLYDILPEGLFHAPIDRKKSLDYKQLRRKHKQDESHARDFFAPLENEFFVQKVKVEQNERVLVDKFVNLKNEFLIDLWGLNKNMPTEYNIKLLQLLPYTHRISGDKDLIALCLEKIIGETVSIKRLLEPYSEIKEQECENRLGMDLVLALEETRVLYPVFEITIGPVERKNIDKFLENSITRQFISIFCDYFIPIEIDTRLNITYLEKESIFVLNETNSPRMGLTTMI